MSTDYRVTTIQGFRVPFENVYSERTETYYLCDHEIDRNVFDFCPQCGRDAKSRQRMIQTPVVDFDLEKVLWEHEGRLSDTLRLVEPLANVILTDGDRDLLVGYSEIFDPHQPKRRINYMAPADRDTLIAEIAALDMTIPFDADSFGIYTVFHIW